MLVTKEELLEIACQAEQTMQAERLPSGTMQTDKWRDAYRLHDVAFAAAKWMEEGGLEEVVQIGPFGRLDIKRGDKVRIKKGAVILSMNPKHNRDNPKIAKKDYEVVIHDVNEGWIGTHWHPHKRDSVEVHREQSICWPGEGGYWCYLDTAMVEKVQ